MYLEWGRRMVKQKDIISVESYNEELDRYNKTEYVVLSRDEYNVVTKQFLTCEIIYTKEKKPYFIPIQVPVLRRNSKVNTLYIYTLKNETGSSKERVGEITTNEFLKIAQATLLNFNFPL